MREAEAVRRGGQASAARRPRPATRPSQLVYQTEKFLAENADKVPGRRQDRGRGGRSPSSRRRSRAPTPRDQGRRREGRHRQPEAGRGDLRPGAGRRRRRRPPARRRRDGADRPTTTSSTPRSWTTSRSRQAQVTESDSRGERDGDARDRSEEEPVIRDNAAIDPETGAGAPAPAEGEPASPAGDRPTRPRLTATGSTELAAAARRAHRRPAAAAGRVRQLPQAGRAGPGAVKEQAVAGVLTELLPVLDDIGRAREHGELSGGFKSVGEALEATVGEAGPAAASARRASPFDPTVHEALMHTLLRRRHRADLRARSSSPATGSASGCSAPRGSRVGRARSRAVSRRGRPS